MTNEQIIKKALVEVMTHQDALRNLVLAMLAASKEKDSILARFSADEHKLSDLLLDSPLSDDFLAQRQKAREQLVNLATQST